VIEVDEEVVRVHGLDAERVACVRREVLEIVADDDLGTDPDGGGQDVTVLRVIGHRRLDDRNQRIWCHRLGKRLFHRHRHSRGAPGIGSVALDEVLGKLGKDAIAPLGHVEIGLRKAQERVPQWSGQKDVGVEND
jgi:hypothetical protein